jgi:subtilase family serine protease
MARTLSLALIALLLCATAAFAAAARPDLGMLKVTTASELTAGGEMTVKDKVGNAGRAAARPSSVGYYLSTDERRSADDILLGHRSVGRLAAGKAKAGSATLKVPNALGLFRVIACADDKRRVRESSERNNCRATARDVHIAAAR